MSSVCKSRDRLLSFGNYPYFPQVPHACTSRDDLPEILAEAIRHYGTSLPFGSGLSYGDSCLAASDQVLNLRPLNRVMHADWAAGCITAEAGATLEEILALAIPQGWFLSVTPGTKYVTLGGAIANDVHGKNHHRRGTFGCFVRRLGLLRSDAGRLICSPETNQQLFAATVGGLGLTGVIEWAEIQLTPISSSQIDALTCRFGSLDEFFDLSDELDEVHDFCVAWVDCTARGRQLGRGIYTAGNFAADGPLTVSDRPRLTVPLTPPFSLVNGLTLRAFNEMYWRKHASGRRTVRLDYDRFFYPLDAVLKWNRIYGRRGFQQYQCVVPPDGARGTIRRLLEAIADSGAASFLAVLKRCGDIASPGLLSFPQRGTTLALDFPQHPRLEARLFPCLDNLVRAAGGRLYPAKDAHMTGEDFRRSYSEWRLLEELRDPGLESRFWARVTGRQPLRAAREPAPPRGPSA